MSDHAVTHADAPSFERYGGSTAENYERYFVPALAAPLAADLIAVAALAAGERVLDVACGTGIVARLAADRVGSTGSVTGLDINPGMLAVARSVAATDTPIHWHQADAQAMALPDDTYDAALCQMGLQFFADKPAALEEIRRVMAPRGRLVANVPGPTPRIFAILEDALREHAGADAAKFVSVVFSLHDTGTLLRLLKDAGFTDASASVSTKTLRLPPPNDFLHQYLSSTPLATALARLDEHHRASLERDVVAQWNALTTGDAPILDLEMVTVTAHTHEGRSFP
jgi:ubiquinone/menaquinone biosynthesis C-methylase UbiE